MIFWLMIMLLVVGIVLLVLGYKDWSDYRHCDDKKSLKERLGNYLYYNDESVVVVGWIVTIIFAIVCGIMLICICDAHAGVEGKRLQMQETYKALNFKAQSECARDEFGLLNKEIIDEIQSWNEDIVYKKVMQDNFWVGIFYADIYDTLETIDLEQMKK